MKKVHPEVYFVASTTLRPGFRLYLESIGFPRWESDSPDDTDVLVEAAGRVCYRSWSPYDPENPDRTNPNVVRVRGNNREYVDNLLAQAHGSVLEHSYFTFILKDVSRVFTHELIRHRPGMAFSQESLRFVRLDKVPFWVSDAIGALGPEAESTYVSAVEAAGRSHRMLASLSGIGGMAFAAKKRLTSLFRRILPFGVASTIMVTGNARAWRHIVATRTADGAEEEARLVGGMIAPFLLEASPSCFQDMYRHADGSWRFSRGPKV